MLSYLRRCRKCIIERRHGGAAIFILLFMGAAMASRLALLVQSLWLVSWDSSLVAAFAWGTLFDLGAALLWSTPLVLLLALLPTRAFERGWTRALAHVILFGSLYLMLFGAVAEWLFWDEFGARFNFIAVDYLVYTTEVLANIRESYPLSSLVAGVGLATAAIHMVLQATGLTAAWLAHAQERLGRRMGAAAAWLGVITLAAVALDNERLPEFANNYNRELAKNGLWAFFSAFRQNELEYDQFYATVPIDDAFSAIHEEFAEHGERVESEKRDTLRYVSATSGGPELHLNVIQITVESLSAEFVGALNPDSRLTPNLDALADKSLVFEQLYATGTRTDRGMEALTLGLPPTPGRSLVKRPHNSNLFTLGSVFRSRGYDTAFLYGGYGYFDNMNAFFGGNGYRVIDRAKVAESDITFANAWGACDEDVFRWTLREADASHAAGKPFHFFVMTTSNHRPFTYPEGRVDLPPKVSGREGAVKYTDYAIGKLIAGAADHPWFNNTIFVIVADHCASSAGRTELPVQNYHIPMFVYAPGGQIRAGRVKDLMSQVDYAPTLLGLLNWSYGSRFYGWDVINASGDRRALVGTYQRLGLYEPGQLHVLSPLNETASYRYNPGTHEMSGADMDGRFTRETIGYYQTASYLYRDGGYRALTHDEERRLAEQHRTSEVASEHAKG